MWRPKRFQPAAVQSAPNHPFTLTPHRVERKGKTRLFVLRILKKSEAISPHFSPHGGVAAVGEAADGVMGANRPGDGRIGDSQRYGTAIRGEHASFYTDHNRLGADRHRLDV
jgi:hypothetical protein